MTPINSKDKGSGFERAIVNKLNDRVTGGGFKRIAGSGAIGTSLGEAELTGDIKGRVEGFPKAFKFECKVGYGGETQLTLKREWLNKIIKEASEVNAFPALIGKFSGARKSDGIQEFVIVDINDFIYVLNLVADMSNELSNAYKKIDKLEVQDG